MTPDNAFPFRSSSLFPALTAALAGLGLVSGAQAQVQVAGDLLVNVDATALPFGSLSAITNSGTLGGIFEARGGVGATPVIGQPNTNATRGIVFDGSDYLQHVASVGGPLVLAPATLVGLNPTTSIEAWVLNPSIPDEETIVAWGFRGGPDGSNMSFLYGSHPSWGAVGHWGAPDIGWNDAGGAPTANVWHHLVYTFDGTTQRVYVDGSLTNSEAVTLNTHAGTAINIGAQYDDSSGAVTAGLRASSTIARLRIHSEALSDSQIANNYAFEKPAITLGPPVFLTQPQNVTTQEQRIVSFTVSMQGEPPISLQWYKGNTALPGANGTSVSYGPVVTADNNAQFYAVASNFTGGSSVVVTSAVATLTVLSDTNPPVLNAALPRTERSIELIFSEAVAAADATNLANYALTGPGPIPSITNVVQNAIGDRIVLTLDGPLGCEVYTVTVSNLRDRAPAANVMPTSSTTFFNNLPTNLRHRYTFNNPPGNATGATVADVVGGADGVVLNGSGTTTFTGQRVTLGGGSSGTAPYVDLPNRLLSTNSTNFAGSGKVTIEGWVKVTGVRSWSRIFDFGSTDIDPTAGFLGGELFGPGGGGEGRDYVFFSAMNGTDVATRQIDFRNEDPGGGGGVSGPYATATFNQDLHFAVTWDEATGLFTVYENGVFKTTMTTDDAMSDLNDVNVWLGRSNWVQDQNMQGEFDEFRLYDRILSTNELRLNFLGGPDSNFGALTNLNLVLTTNTLYTNMAARVSVLANFATLGVRDLAAFGCVQFSTTDSNVAYITADGFIVTGVPGTATVTAVFGGLTNAEVVEVVIDTVPPTLVSVRANGSTSIELTYSEPVEIATATEAGNYMILTAGGNIEVVDVVRLPDPSKVLITLATPMACEVITVNVSFVADESPLFNQIVENSRISFFYYVASGLQHRYTFNNAATNSATDVVVEDAVGTADGVIRGAGAALTGNRIVLPGGSSGSAAYVDLPNGLLTANSTNNGGSGQITVEGWVQVTGNRNWARIFDFGSTGPSPVGPGGEIPGPGGSGDGIDYFTYSAQVGTDVNNRRFEIQNRDAGNVGAVTIDHPTTFNQMGHFAVTWDERTGALRVFQNGVRVIAGSTVIPYTAINDVNVWLGRSVWTGDQNMQGEFDEFRIYNRIISTNEIAVNRLIGPDNALGQPLSYTVIQATNVQIGSAVRPFTLVTFPNATNLDLSASGCVTFTSSNPSVISNTPSGLVAVGLGTTTLSASFVGLPGTNVVVTVAQRVLQFRGLTPGTTAEIWVTTDLGTNPINWTLIGTAPVLPDGRASFVDTVPRGPQAFYRAVSP